MSEPRARDVIAGVLGEHYPSKVFRPVPGKGLTSVCNCGELVPVSNVLSVSADYAPHRADALIAAGVAVPECGGQCCTHVTGDDDG